MTSKMIAFGWYGGKYTHLDWLLPLLPYTTHYCEPFGGSAAVLINRAPSPVETYNDVDGELVNFFSIVGARIHCDQICCPSRKQMCYNLLAVFIRRQGERDGTQWPLS